LASWHDAGNGNRIGETDQLGRSITYSYDALNRETGETWYSAGSCQV
jgi:YD repeat-containing protein